MPGPVFLPGDELALHTVEETDHAWIHEHWSRPGIRHGTNQNVPRTEDEWGRFLDDAVAFLPCVDGEPVGLVWLFGVDETAGHAELGYWIAPGARGNGYATAAARLAVRYAFDERGFHRVQARVFDWNEASARVLEKLGFREEGRLREHYYVDGEHVDARLFGLLAAEWASAG